MIQTRSREVVVAEAILGTLVLRQGHRALAVVVVAVAIVLMVVLPLVIVGACACWCYELRFAGVFFLHRLAGLLCFSFKLEACGLLVCA